jgi:hypothetical protein
MSFIKQYFRDLILILTEPNRFFRDRYPQISFSQALAFGVLSNWISALLLWMTRIVKHESLLDGFKKIREQLDTLPIWKDIPDSIWQQGGIQGQSFFNTSMIELGGILFSPFQSLINFCMGGIVLFIGAYLLVPKREETHENDSVAVSPLIRLTAVSAAPAVVAAILGFLPFGLNSFIGWIYGVVILVVGISDRYRVSVARAVGTLILPWFVMSLLCGCLVMAFGAFFMAIFGTLFAGH